MPTIGATLTLTSTRTLYWDLTTDSTISGTPMVAILPAGAEPTSTTVWATATWDGGETVTNGIHTRRLSLLVAGPNGPTNGSPTVVPSAGEYSTYIRLDTSSERIEVPSDLLVVG